MHALPYSNILPLRRLSCSMRATPYVSRCNMINDSLVHLLSHLVATRDAPMPHCEPNTCGIHTRYQHTRCQPHVDKWRPAGALLAPCWRPAGALLTLSWYLPCTGDRCGAVESARTPCAESSGRCQAKEWKRRVACSMSGEVGDARELCTPRKNASRRSTGRARGLGA